MTPTAEMLSRLEIHARCQAAAAVVAVRLGLPLTMVVLDEPDRSRIEFPDGYLDTTAAEWPTVRVTDQLERALTAMAASLLVATTLQRPWPELEPYRQRAVRICALLGIRRSASPARVQSMLDEHESRAHALLMADDAAAWNAVAHGLLAMGRLSGSAVQHLVAEHDRRRGTAGSVSQERTTP